MTTLRTAGRPAPLVLAAVVMLLSTAAPGCAPKGGRIPAATSQPDRWLYERGSSTFQSRGYMRAREYFRQIIDSYPQSPYRPDAKLGLGDCYLSEGTAESLVYAQNEFREFLTFYPTHPRADYAQFKLAMTYFKQIPKPERDQTETKNAVSEFVTMIERYPNSMLLQEARQRLRDARNQLGLSEYGVGLFYYRARWYPGALDRFTALLRSDPEFSYRDAVYYYLADTQYKLGQKAEALVSLDRLATEFGKSNYLERGKRLSDTIKTELTPGALAAPIRK
jgi:outer membrane protein assembly factor BamD